MPADLADPDSRGATAVTERDDALEREARGFTPPEEPADRLGIVWGAKWWIIGVTVLITAVTFGVSSAIPPTYSSNANVLVSAVAPTGLTKDAVDASNDLASQYAQLVNSSGVIAPAARALEMPPSTLGSSISAGTVAAQNIVAITATAPNALAAQRRANAVASQFVAAQTRRNAQLARAYTSAVAASQRRLDAQTAKTLAQLSSPSAAVRAAAAGTLPLLLSQRQQQAAATAQASANTQPALSVYEPAGLGSQVVPRPVLYAGIALIVSFVAAAQIAALVGVHRAGRARV